MSGFTKEKSQDAITAEIDRLRELPDLEQGVLREPWTVSGSDTYERAKRRLQVELVTAKIQPVNARGVGYALLARKLIKDKDDFRRVVELVKNMRAESRMPFHWITDEGRELWTPDGAASVSDWLKRGSRYYRNAWNEAETQIIICVEKAGQHGVYLPVAQEYDVPLVATEGFCSLTRKNDLAEMVRADPRDTIFANLGDHDDSGVDILTDTHNWVQDLSGEQISSIRIAVLPEHVDRYKLETRMPGEERPHAGAEARLDKIDPLNIGPVYSEAIGHFDLDALDPNVGRDLLRDYLRQHLSEDKLAAVRRREQRERAEIKKLAQHWPAVRRFLRTQRKGTT